MKSRDVKKAVGAIFGRSVLYVFGVLVFWCLVAICCSGDPPPL